MLEQWYSEKDLERENLDWLDSRMKEVEEKSRDLRRPDEWDREKVFREIDCIYKDIQDFLSRQEHKPVWAKMAEADIHYNRGKLLLELKKREAAMESFAHARLRLEQSGLTRQMAYEYIDTMLILSRYMLDRRVKPEAVGELIEIVKSCIPSLRKKAAEDNKWIRFKRAGGWLDLTPVEAELKVDLELAEFNYYIDSYDRSTALVRGTSGDSELKNAWELAGDYLRGADQCLKRVQEYLFSGDEKARGVLFCRLDLEPSFGKDTGELLIYSQMKQPFGKDNREASRRHLIEFFTDRGLYHIKAAGYYTNGDRSSNGIPTGGGFGYREAVNHKAAGAQWTESSVLVGSNLTENSKINLVFALEYFIAVCSLESNNTIALDNLALIWQTYFNGADSGTNLMIDSQLRSVISQMKCDGKNDHYRILSWLLEWLEKGLECNAWTLKKAIDRRFYIDLGSYSQHWKDVFDACGYEQIPRQSNRLEFLLSLNVLLRVIAEEAGDVYVLIRHFGEMLKELSQGEDLCGLLDYLSLVAHQEPGGLAADRDSIRQFLYRILRLEPNNMFALNLLVVLDQPVIQGDTYQLYLTMRQSTLKHFFRDIDKAYGRLVGSYYHKNFREIVNLKKGIIVFYNDISEFLARQKGDPPLSLCHYTKLKTLKHLFKKHAPTKFRFYNAEYLNDPMEGKVLLSLLKKSREQEADSGCPVKTDLMDAILHAYDASEVAASSVYIGSFATLKDHLNMWTQYGDGGKGVCLLIDEDSFDRTDTISLYDLRLSDDEVAQREDSRYKLKRVIYVPEQMELGAASEDASECSSPRERHHGEEEFQDIERAQKLIRIITENVQMVEGTMGKLYHEADREDYLLALQKDLNEEAASVPVDLDRTALNRKLFNRRREAFYQTTINTMILILDQVRYLIKSDAYRYEKEYRIIKYASAPLYDEHDTADIPRLYIEMKRPLKYTGMITGPLVSGPASAAVYMEHNLKPEERSDGIKEMVFPVIKSSVPFRSVSG